MRKIREWLARFMYGRNGVDSLYKFSIVLYLVLVVIQAFFVGTDFYRGVFGLIIRILLMAFLVWTLFRFFSRNIQKRQAENRKFLNIKTSIKKFFYLRKRMFKDRKTHVYRRCPYCNCVLRLPKRKGNHSVTCPKCKKIFDVKI